MRDMDIGEDKIDAILKAMRQTMIGMGARDDLVDAAIEEAKEKNVRKFDE
jgi:predicted GNAT family acetyltransferase